MTKERPLSNIKTVNIFCKKEKKNISFYLNSYGKDIIKIFLIALSLINLLTLIFYHILLYNLIGYAYMLSNILFIIKIY